MMESSRTNKQTNKNFDDFLEHLSPPPLFINPQLQNHSQEKKMIKTNTIIPLNSNNAGSLTVLSQ